MLQLIGTKSDKSTRAAERYLKERRIPYQFVDLSERGLSPREWESIFNSVEDADSLLDKESQFWKKNGYSWREIDPKEEVMDHIELLKKPVVRIDGKAHVGWSEEWLKGRV